MMSYYLTQSSRRLRSARSAIIASSSAHAQTIARSVMTVMMQQNNYYGNDNSINSNISCSTSQNILFYTSNAAFAATTAPTQQQQRRLRLLQQQQPENPMTMIMMKCKKFSSTKKDVLESEINDSHQRQDKVIIRKRLRNQQQHNDADDEYGVYACRDFQKGDIVMEGRAQSYQRFDAAATSSIFTTPGTHTIQVDWSKHVKLDLPSRFVNHICGMANVGIVRPTTKAVFTDNDDSTNIIYYTFVALQDIAKDEEILWDYECSEYESFNGGFECLCGSTTCRGRILGYKYNGDIVTKAYGQQYIAPYLILNKQEQQEESPL